MTNISALPKSDIVSDADLARAAAAGDRARKPRFRDVAGIRLADNLDSLSRDEIEATQQHNLRATLTAARQSTNVWRRFPGLEAVDTVDDLAALPLLSAADLAAGCPPHSADLVFDPRSPGLVLRSSGTASRPKVRLSLMGFHRPGPTSRRAWGPSGIGDTAEPCRQLPVRRGLERSVPVRPGHHAVPAGACLPNGRVHLARRGRSDHRSARDRYVGGVTGVRSGAVGKGP